MRLSLFRDIFQRRRAMRDDDAKIADPLLKNWGRWTTWGDPPWPHDKGVCASAEGKYIIPVWDQDEPPADEPDMIQGEKMESLISQMCQNFPTHAQLLRLHYATLPDPSVKAHIESHGGVFTPEKADAIRARRCHIRPEDYWETMLSAYRMVVSAWPVFARGR